jgi:predicted N-acetyltransferase YhbS
MEIMIEIRVMQKNDIDAVVELMTRAFQNAALYAYFEPRDKKRTDFLRMLFSHRLPFGFEERDAEVAYDGKKILGAALWTKPGTAPAENHALTEAVRQYDATVFEKWQTFHKILFGSLGSVCPEPHWSLAPIAVIPEFQGKGIAHALFQRKLTQIDAAHDPCLLGTQDEVNTKIYARYGFKIVQETVVPQKEAGASAVTSWAMLRKQ